MGVLGVLGSILGRWTICKPTKALEEIMKTSFWIALNISLLVLLVSVCLVIGDVGQVTVDSIRPDFNLDCCNFVIILENITLKTLKRTEKLSIRPENTEVYKQWIQPDQVWFTKFSEIFQNSVLSDIPVIFQTILEPTVECKCKYLFMACYK